MSNRTSDGYSCITSTGLKKGDFVCEGKISPAQDIAHSPDFVYDVIVVGGGYAGLSAARDLTEAGRSVLLLEGRDRVDGRTYTVKEDDFNFEMGGTWVSHYQPNTLRELVRYNLERDLIKTRTTGHENDYFSLELPKSPRKDFSQEKAAELTARAWNIFVNVDGQGGKKICPLPYQQLGNIDVDRQEVEKWDAMSSYDRIEQIKDQLSEEELALLIPVLLIIHGGQTDLKTSGLWDIIKSHALNGYQFANMDEIWFSYKLRQGQSHLARMMFDEAVDCGLQYSFQTHVESIRQLNNATTAISTKDGKVFRARKVVCTIPLNLLKSVRFEPPLSQLRQEAVEAGHINFMTKIHAVVEGSGMASWNGTSYLGNLLCAYGDGVLSSGDAHLVAFGADKRSEFVPEEHPESVVQAFEDFHPMQVKKLVFHNWNTDPYSQAGPSWFAPGYMSKYQEELQKRHGNIFFASADWAHGWRAFIDGALEQGFLSALEILRELRKEDKALMSQESARL